MSIHIKTDHPLVLLEKIKNLIESKEIVTWEYDRDGDFTHTATQWTKKAWFRSFIKNGDLIFGILCTAKKAITVEEYAVYHGRFIEMLLSHFDGNCSKLEVSPLPTNYDKIKPEI